jgi:hypothetical protein
MAKRGIFKCTDCEHRFLSQEGGTMMSELFLCISCDEESYVRRNDSPQRITCESCGSEALPGLKRMCPKCRYRSTELIIVHMRLD